MNPISFPFDVLPRRCQNNSTASPVYAFCNLKALVDPVIKQLFHHQNFMVEAVIIIAPQGNVIA